jgi:hypothetical protein
MGSPMHVHVDVREEATGFAVGPDQPEREDEGGLISFNPPPSSPELPAESPLGVVPSSEGDHVLVRASEPGRIRVEIPSQRESIVPLSLRMSSSNISMGAIGIDVVESELDGNQLGRAVLCARHTIDGDLQAGWLYEWQVPDGFSSQSIGHASESGSGNRCIVSDWDRATSVDERSEIFRVSFGALSAEIPASLAMGFAE